MMLHDRLQYRLQNSEPKCKNCRNWLQKQVATDGDRPIYGTIGQCLINTPYQTEVAWFTTDLQVCSRWEIALDAEREGFEG